jgi:phage repressor protein C with HTH and peptisase S24 domain
MKRAHKDAVRTFLAAELESRDITMAAASKMVGKSHAYIQQFLERGVPKELPERVRSRLAEALGVDESLLGRKTLSKRPLAVDAKPSHIRNVGEYNALVSAGGGISLADEEKIGEWPLPRPYLDDMNLSGNGLAVVPVKGDSMEPTLRSGDRVLIDMGDKNVSQGGLFVLWDGSGRVVKRVERVPGAKPPLLALISDNPLHTRYQVSAIDVDIIGRVVWAARRL